MRKPPARSALIIGFCVLACGMAAAAPKSGHAPPSASIDDDLFYQAGVKQYAAGQRDKALGSFRVALRHHPGNRLMISTIRRVEGEVGQPPAVEFRREALEASWFDQTSDAFDEFLLVDVSNAMNFDDSLGDAESSVGTLEALNGRVAQLQKEQEFALRHGQAFLKEREMRSLVRRMPTVAA
jgi:hypothetical protein